MERSEVRGIYFETARKYLLERLGEEGLAQLVNRFDRQYREVVLDPDPSQWYPERMMQQSLAALHAVVAQGSDEAFMDIIDDCTCLGVSRFFRAIFRMRTPQMVLAKTPAMWAHVRRGPGTLEVETSERSAVLRFTQFPYFRDTNYRLLAVAIVRSLIRMTGATPHIEVAEWSWDALTLRAFWT